MSNVQACREVGVHRITGTRWRDGRNMVVDRRWVCGRRRHRGCRSKSAVW